MKYSYEKKLEVVRSVISGMDSTRSAATKLGTDHKHIRRWVALYEAHGEAGLRIKRGSYSGDFKLSVIRYMYENHLSLFETAVKFGISSDSVVLHWDRIYSNEGPAGLYRDNRGKMNAKPKKTNSKSRNGEDLIAENERLRTEVAYLKKLKVLVEQRIARENGKGQKPSKD